MGPLLYGYRAYMYTHAKLPLCSPYGADKKYHRNSCKKQTATLSVCLSVWYREMGHGMSVNHSMADACASEQPLTCSAEVCQCQCQSWIYTAHKRKASNALNLWIYEFRNLAYRRRQGRIYSNKVGPCSGKMWGPSCTWGSRPYYS